MNGKKLETSKDFKHGLTFFATDDTKKAYDEMGVRFKGCYPRLRWKIVNMSIKLMSKTIKEKKLKPGDDLESALGI